VTLVSAVSAPVSAVARALQPGRLVIAYVTGSGGAAEVARSLCARGFGASELTVLEQLGGPRERIRPGSADAWQEGEHDPLAVVAIRCIADAGGAAAILPTVPGLPDGAYEHDGALTKRHVRAATLAALAPVPGALLWDIGAGSGSIGIEWLRAEPTARAIAIESRRERAARASRNADALGVPQLRIVHGEAPQALGGLEAPDAVFIGGGLSDGVLAAAWDALLAGGRMVVNAVTVEGERILLDAVARHGGELVKLSVSQLEPIGSFTAWRTALPIVQWSARKPR
jgi:precorrin-6Y C5,15-methyltransferase (decarboxylating)